MEYKRIKNVYEVWIRDGEIIIFGALVDPEDPDHNCDRAGCRSYGGHILFHGVVCYPEKYYTPETQEGIAND